MCRAVYVPSKPCYDGQSVIVICPKLFTLAATPILCQPKLSKMNQKKLGLLSGFLSGIGLFSQGFNPGVFCF